MTTHTFKVGDRVRCINREDDDPVQVGDCGTVIELVSIGVSAIDWDVPREGMTGKVWAMVNSELERI